MVKAEGVGNGGLLLRYDVYRGGRESSENQPTDRESL